MAEATPTRVVKIIALPLQLMKLLSAEAVAMADSLEVCGASVTHVTSYITKLRSLAKVYDKVRLTWGLCTGPSLPPSPSRHTGY